MRAINRIIIHCTATPENRSHTAKDIERWHIERGYRTIGYHYLIRLDGTVETGRSEATVGAHAKNYNANSIGTCYVGGCDAQMKPKDTRTASQTASLIKLLQELKKKYPQAETIGHSEVSNRACPSFNVQSWLNDINMMNYEL